MAKFEERARAHSLRKQGRSISDIAEQLGVSKSSVSVWCRDVELTLTQKEHLHRRSVLAGNKGRIIGAEMNKQKRLNAVKLTEMQGIMEVGKLSDRDLMIAASALFWAEGAKSGSRFVFINSDPDMVLLMMRYLTEVLKIDRSRISATVQINRVHEKRIKSVYRFWSDLLDLPKESFGRPYYINVKPKKIYKNHESYYGILRLRVSNGTSLQYKLLGYISALKQQK
jgi:transposase-like protein